MGMGRLSRAIACSLVVAASTALAPSARAETVTGTGTACAAAGAAHAVVATDGGTEATIERTGLDTGAAGAWPGS